MVHPLQPGQHVSVKDGRVRVIETATGRVVKDLGESAKPEDEEGAPSQPASGVAPSLPDVGWIENAQWRNGGANPIAYFSTSGLCLRRPRRTTIRSSFCLMACSRIRRPTSYSRCCNGAFPRLGGGAYWSISNWYADGQGGASVVAPVVEVNSGTVLQGVMTCTGNSGSGYNYTCKFIGYPAVDLTLTDVEEMTWAYETLECYGPYNPTTKTFNPLSQCSDYPSTPLTAMYAIEIKTGTPGMGGADADIAWFAMTSFKDCGQVCDIVNNASPGGEVDLYCRSHPWFLPNNAVKMNPAPRSRRCGVRTTRTWISSLRVTTGRCGPTGGKPRMAGNRGSWSIMR